MFSRKELGRWGEELVLDQYCKAGFDLVAKNVRVNRAELDLLFEKQGVLYSVEVKTRRSLFFGYPEESINRRKRERLYRATALYAAQQGRYFHSIIVQVCAVIIKEGRVSCKIYTVD